MVDKPIGGSDEGSDELSESARHFWHRAQVRAAAFHMTRPPIDPEVRERRMNELAHDVGLDDFTESQRTRLADGFEQMRRNMGWDGPTIHDGDPLTHDQAVQVYGVEVVDEAEALIAGRLLIPEPGSPLWYDGVDI